MQNLKLVGDPVRLIKVLMAAAAVACAARDVSARVLVPFKAHGQMRNGEKTVLIWRENGSVTVTKPCTVE